MLFVDGMAGRRSGLAAQADSLVREQIQTCMGLFLSSSRFWFVAGSLFGGVSR
jgi:hypothetical protein